MKQVILLVATWSSVVAALVAAGPLSPATAVAATPRARKDEAAALSRVAAAKYGAGEFAKAAEFFHEAMRIDPDFVAYLYSAARSEEKGGMLADAERDYRRFIDAAPRGHEKLGDAAKNLSAVQALRAESGAVAAAKAAADQASAQQAAAQKLVAEQAGTKVAADKAAAEKASVEKAAADKARAETAARDKAAADTASADRAKRDKIAADSARLAAEQTASKQKADARAAAAAAQAEAAIREAGAREAARARLADKAVPATVHGAGAALPSSGAAPWIVSGLSLGAAGLAVAAWAWSDSTDLAKRLNSPDMSGRIDQVSRADAVTQASSINTRAYIAGGIGAVGAVLVVVGIVKASRAPPIAVMPALDGRGAVVAWRF